MFRRGEGFILLMLAAAIAFAFYAQLSRENRPYRTPDLPYNWQTLVELNNEMIRAHGRGDWTNAAQLAAKILSQPKWKTFVPANAVMGSVLARDGDYDAAEAFFRAALSGKVFAPQPVVLNDYADTLCHLRRYNEAEIFARRAITLSGGTVPLFKLTLEQILSAAGKSADELNSKEKET